MPLRRTVCWYVAALLLCLAQVAHAEDTAPRYPSLLVEDVKHVVTSPSRWDDQDWRDAGWASLAVVGTAVLIDRPWRDEMRRHAPNNSPFMLQVERFGAQYAAGTVGIFFLAGTLGGDETSLQVAEDGLAASLIASGLITPAIKLIAGRQRPRDNAGIYNFKPFSNSNSSFPSGHTTEAFALASVIANHYEETWVACAAYSIAGLVGVARTYHDAHFASDVVAGAMIGTLTGKSVVSYNRQRRAGKIALLPDVAPGKIGLRLAGSF
jgi:membrane-associated phospholipid phosphatase